MFLDDKNPSTDCGQPMLATGHSNSIGHNLSVRLSVVRLLACYKYVIQFYQHFIIMYSVCQQVQI